MQPATVLAGPIEFSPAEIAFFFAVIALAALVVSSPGWVALGEAARRRAKAAGSGRRGRVWAWVGGALTGMGVSALVAAVLASALGAGGVTSLATVVAAWFSCWCLAVAVWPTDRRPSPTGSAAGSGTGEGWGR